MNKINVLQMLQYLIDGLFFHKSNVQDEYYKENEAIQKYFYVIQLFSGAKTSFLFIFE